LTSIESTSVTGRRKSPRSIFIRSAQITRPDAVEKKKGMALAHLNKQLGKFVVDADGFV
jgi:hypothetical protein